MRKVLVACALAGLLATPAQAQQGAVFQPSSVWAADYGDDYCRLVRSFSNGSDEVTLIMQRIQPGADTQMMLIGDSLKTYRTTEEFEWSFLPDGSDRTSRFLRAETGSGQPYYRLDNIMLTPPARPAPGAPPGPPRYDRATEATAARAITGLNIKSGLTSPVRIETGSLGDAVGALQACTDDLMQTWGLDAAKHQAMATPAALAPNPDGVLPQGTIAFSDFAKFAGGSNQLRLMVDASGKVTDCVVFSPTLDAAQNERICTLAKQRATFTPAKDADGVAMASFWMGSPQFLGPPIGGGR